MPPLAPPSGGRPSGRPSGHAVARSSELLSCARTALRITQQQQHKQRQQQQQQQLISSDPTSSSSLSTSNADAYALLHLDPSSLTLHQNQPDDHRPTSNNNNATTHNPAMEALHHATLSLRLLDSSLSNLSSLVRRRGHTNDPTDEIHRAITQFRQYATEIKEILEKTLQTAALADLIPTNKAVTVDGNNDADGGGAIICAKSSGQRVRHYEIVGMLLKERVEERMKRFKDVMTVREEVIKDLTRRRKELLEDDNTSSNNGAGSGSTVTTTVAAGKVDMSALGRKSSSTATKSKINSQLQSPLFTSSRVNKIRNSANNSSRSGRPTNNAPTRTGGKGGYGGSTTSAGYGGGYGSQAAGGGGYTGLRQRPTGSGGGTSMSTSATTSSCYKNDNTNNGAYRKGNVDDGIHSNGNSNNNNSTNIHADQQSLLQIEERRTMRQTKHRLQSARQAETMLADLTNMFGKMSELIHSQGDTISKIEDDVEAGVDNVNAGVDEITKLNQITKGNRSLIVKVFAILIFFIIVTRWF